jgi:hypothetical protein
MKPTRKVVIVGFASVVVAPCDAASADVIWDNGGYAQEAGYSSERDTLVPESWTVDDVVLGDEVVVREFQWTSLMSLDDPVGADFLVLTADFQPVVELRDLAYTRELIGESFGLDLYRVTLSDLGVRLDPGRYYLGGRMVGSGDGRAFAALRSEIRGQTQAYIRSEHFGFPDWTPVIEGLGGAYDMVFTVYGDIIPAPATLALALPCLLALPRRR